MEEAGAGIFLGKGRFPRDCWSHALQARASADRHTEKYSEFAAAAAAVQAAKIPSATEASRCGRHFGSWEDLDSRLILSKFRITGFQEHWPNVALPVTAEGIVITNTELQQS